MFLEQEYEVRECSAEHDRECQFCDMEGCDPTYEYVLLEGCSTKTGSRACASCVEKPPNSYFSAGRFPLTCSWRCSEGYYSELGDRSMQSCQRCTEFNATTCPAGYVFDRFADTPSVHTFR